MVRDKRLAIRWTDEELAEIERIAREEDRTRGNTVRKLVDEALTARRERESKS
jgi:hypothetical protein